MRSQFNDADTRVTRPARPPLVLFPTDRLAARRLLFFLLTQRVGVTPFTAQAFAKCPLC